MYIYLIIFILSCTVIYIGNKPEQTHGKIIAFAGILIPCILAGLRASTIGTDVNVYVKPMVDLANNSENFIDFLNSEWFHIWTNKTPADFELGFTLLIYISTKLSFNLQFILFIIQVLISLPIYYGIKKYKSLQGKEWVCMLLYYLLFFNVGLNIMRQCISVAILFYGASILINNNKHIKYFIFLFIAFLFHKSSIIIGIVLYIMYLCFSKKYLGKYYMIIQSRKIKLSKILIVLFSTIFIIIISNSEIIIKFLEFIRLNQYIGYIDGKLSFSIKSIIKNMPIFMLIIVSIKDFINNKNSYLFISLYIISFFISQFASVSEYGGRLSLGFEIFNIVLLTKVCFCRKRYRRIKIICILTYALFYWYYYFVYGGSNETVPYLFYFA